MLKVIEGFVKRRFKTWKEYERVAGIPARHGKRRVALYLERLERLLKPLGLRIKLVKSEFPMTLAENLSVSTPYSEEEIEPIIDFAKRRYGLKDHPLTDKDPIVVEKVTLALKVAQEKAIPLFNAIVKVTDNFYKGKDDGKSI